MPLLQPRQYVRLLGAVYESGEMLYSSGRYGVVETVEKVWLHSRFSGIYIAGVRLQGGKVVYVNERACEEVHGPV